ncbi:MAG TPA: hypothetical protein VFP61_01010 [Acidimicrobiales bacterium]|nr:hypothetical protein [Acidimicrobiales bacterium]
MTSYREALAQAHHLGSGVHGDRRPPGALPDGMVWVTGRSNASG